jgi:hypothetical protein
MQASHENLHSPDVVAVFDNQDDVDEAILRLRVNGFKDHQIGYFMWHPTAGLVDLYDRSFAGVGVVVGGIVGCVLGVAIAWYLNQWSEVNAHVNDFFGLAATLGTFVGMTGAFIGWAIGVEIHRRGVDAPYVDPRAGAYVLALHAGDARDRAWTILYDYGGHEPPPAMMAQPSAV